MRLNPKDVLFGQPILKIREVIRFAIREQLYGQTEQQIIIQVAKALKQSPSIAKGGITNSDQRGVSDVNNRNDQGDTFYRVEPTENGQPLGVSSANAPISRQKADQLLQELLQRVKRR